MLKADAEINKSMSEQEKVEKHVYRVLSSPLHHADVDGGVGSKHSHLFLGAPIRGSFGPPF